MQKAALPSFLLLASALPPGAGGALFLTCSSAASTGVLVAASIDWTGVVSMLVFALLYWSHANATVAPRLLETERVSGPSTSKSETERRSNSHTVSTGEIRIGNERTRAGSHTLTHTTQTITLTLIPRHFHHVLENISPLKQEREDMGRVRKASAFFTARSIPFLRRQRFPLAFRLLPQPTTKK